MCDEITKTVGMNPFVSSFYHYSNFYDEIPKLGEAIEALKNNESYSKSKILYAMFEYARIYKQFRPSSITQNDAYFGTVQRMDDLYHFLFEYLNADLSITFSYSPGTYYQRQSKMKHGDVNWDEIIADIKDIDRAILITMEEHAVDLYCILGDNTAPYIWRLVIGFILRYFDEGIISKDDIELKDNSVFIKGKKIVFKNNHQLSSAIFNWGKDKL